MEYYRVVKTPMELDRLIKGEEEREKNKAFRKSLMRKFGYLLLALFILSGPILMLSAYEAHVINITAHICIPLQTRTPGYWKTHEEVATPLLPQPLGCDEEGNIFWVNTFEQAFDILDSNAQDMRDKLMSHLLAMKFNVAYYGIGGYIPDICGANGKTIDELIVEADALLCDPNAKRQDLQDIKNIFDCSNNLGEPGTRICLGLIPVRPSSFSSISNEVLLMTDEGEVIQAEAPAEGEEPIQVTPPPEENPEAPVEEPVPEEPAPEETPTPESTPETTPEPTPESAPEPTTETNTTTNETLPPAE